MWRVLVFVMLLGCGSYEITQPETSSAVMPEMHGNRTIRTEEQFRRYVVGQTLMSDGVEMTIGADYSVNGRYRGKPFSGSWEFRKGLFCHSATRDVHSMDRQCFRVTQHEREIMLTLMPE
ncbi:hypothetical protein [Qingshengfaniella alkalisoli]|uniref:Uncharacterized protein n=1 Tax=Qingshengfaniella alkalisoli TaxID=2599296 RepID=A0A5B8IVF9_9RHOB|nr:hypothetical protein [Qingshengfaniella alkalisoli]QDY69433.1 hypothetical protein FPZ52_07200 [Qingshengfaniella alkalisoli]